MGVKRTFASALLAFAALAVAQSATHAATSIAVDEVVYEEAPGADRFVADQFADITPSRTPLASFGPFQDRKAHV